MADVRKTWQTPQLVILVRGNPEDDVLAKCKMGGRSGGPQGDILCMVVGCAWKKTT